MKGYLRRWLVGGAAVAVALGAAGGFAYARTTGGGATGTVCAKTADGQLRLDTGGGCLPSERAIQWGPSTSIERAYAARLGDVGTWRPIGESRGDATQLTSVHLDEGSYLVQAQVIGADFTGTGTLVCIAGNNALGGFAVGQGSVGNTGGYANQVNLDFQTTFAVPAGGGDVDLSCWLAPDGDGGRPIVGLGDVIATEVDALG